MNIYNEFAPQTFINLKNNDVFISLPGILNWIINNSALESIPARNWNITDLKSFLIKHNINIISKQESNFKFAFNDINYTANMQITPDEEFGASNTKRVELLNSNDLLKLVKLLQLGNSTTKQYQELMFKGFYQDQKSGLFVFNLKDVLYSLVNNSRMYRSITFRSTLNELKIFASKNKIQIESINPNQIEFLTMPEEIRPKTIDQSFDTIFADTTNNMVVVDKNAATAKILEVISTKGLCELYQAMQELVPDYSEVSSGVICPIDKDNENLYSVEATLEIINLRTERINISISKSAVRKQIKKLVSENPDKFKTFNVKAESINFHNKIRLYKSNKELYLNEPLFEALINFYLQRYANHNPNPGPQFELLFPSIMEEFKKRALTFDHQSIEINYDTINGTESGLNYYKENLEEYIKERVKWLKAKLDYLYDGITTKIRYDMQSSLLLQVEAGKKILQECCKQAQNYPNPCLRSILQNEIPQAYKQIISDRGQQDYKQGTKINYDELKAIDQEFEENFSKKVKDLLVTVKENFNQVMQIINNLAIKVHIMIDFNNL